MDVDVVTLDSLSLKPNLIKIDVQGAELDVLKGGCGTISNFRPVIFIEIPDDNNLEEQLFQFLNIDLNYSVKKLANNFLCLPN